MTWRNPGLRKYGLGYYETSDPAEVEACRIALEADIAGCMSCQNGTPVRHSTSYVQERRMSPVVKKTQTVAVTYHCRSFSRWYNPETGQMEGHAHCTCDGCW